MPKVSIIIITYNRAHTLARAIQSCLNQTYQDFELIIINDGSQDETQNVVQSFQNRKIKYFHHPENRGQANSRNAGIKQSQGEYIAFLDDDDEWLEDKLQKQISLLQNSPEKVGAVYTGIKKSNQSKPSLPKYRGSIFHILLTKNWIGTTSSPLIRKSCFDHVGLFDTNLPLAVDWDMWLQISQKYDIDFVNEVLVIYYPQKLSITMDSLANKEGFKIITNKYQSEIRTLPRNLRSKHYYNIGLILWWRRNFILSFQYFIRAFSINPVELYHFLSYFTKKTIKHFSKRFIKKGCHH